MVYFYSTSFASYRHSPSLTTVNPIGVATVTTVIAVIGIAFVRTIMPIVMELITTTVFIMVGDVTVVIATRV